MPAARYVGRTHRVAGGPRARRERAVEVKCDALEVLPDWLTGRAFTHKRLYVGWANGTARAFAAKKGIGLVGDEELARLLAK
jgi:hypothetical protein